MPYYRALKAYGGVVRAGDRETRFSFAAGDVVLVELDQVAALVRDGAGLDLSTPLTEADYAEEKARKESEENADAELRAEKRRVIREHAQAWGSPRCPGNSIGWTGGPSFGDGPHDVPPAVNAEDVDAGLFAEQVDRDGRSWWVVACKRHLPRWVKHPEPPPAPPVIDREQRTYRVLRPYGGEVDVPGDGIGWSRRRLRLEEGTDVTLAGVVAVWLNRDAPGTLAPLDANGEPILPVLDGEESTQDTTPEQTPEEARA